MLKKLMIFLIINILSSVAWAENKAQEPVMIIRFNKEEVQFENSLAKLVKKALSIKSDIKFKLVSFIPSEDHKLAAEQNVKAIISEMIKSHVPKDNIESKFQENHKLSYNEIYIYAN